MDEAGALGSMMRCIVLAALSAASAWAQCGQLVINPLTHKQDCVGTNTGSVTVNSQTCTIGSSCTVTAAPTSGLIRIGSPVVVASPAASITFSAIPQIYSDLVLVFYGRMDTGTDEDVYMLANGDSGANYCQQFWGVGNTGPSIQGNNCSSNTKPGIATIPGSGALANMPGLAKIEIIGYANTIFNKIAHSQLFWRGSTTDLFLLGWQWNNTSAITSLTLAPTTGGHLFVTGTTATLYGRF